MYSLNEQAEGCRNKLKFCHISIFLPTYYKEVKKDDDVNDILNLEIIQLFLKMSHSNIRTAHIENYDNV